MKAYAACPGCKTRNEPIWIMDQPNRPYYICLCIECKNMYYQLSTINVKSRDILLDFDNPVPYITKTIEESDKKEREIKMIDQTTL